jgi:lipopolysaccharide biosynthesis glycosyltransferase
MMQNHSMSQISENMHYVAFCIDNNVAVDVTVCIESLLANNTYPITILIIHSVQFQKDVTEKIEKTISKYKQHLIYKKIDDSKIKQLPVFGDYTIATYYRLFIPDLLPVTVKRVLYLDADIIVDSDISELFTLDFDGKSIGTVLELGQNKKHAKLIGIKHGTYFNAGVVLMNLEKIRKENSFHKMMQILIQNPKNFPYQDQDALNVYFQNDILYLPHYYNYCYYFNTQKPKIPFNKAKIIHYAGTVKPKYFESLHPLRKVFLKYMAQSVYADDLPKPSLLNYIKKIRSICGYLLAITGLWRIVVFIRMK